MICCVSPGLVPSQIHYWHLPRSALYCRLPALQHSQGPCQQLPFKFLPQEALERDVSEVTESLLWAQLSSGSPSPHHTSSPRAETEVPDPASGPSSWRLLEPLLLWAPEGSSSFLLLLISALPRESMLDFELNQHLFFFNWSTIHIQSYIGFKCTTYWFNNSVHSSVPITVSIVAICHHIVLSQYYRLYSLSSMT